MSQIIERLESRQLFAVSAAAFDDILALQSEGNAIKSHAAAFIASVKVQAKALTADLQRLHASASDKALLAKLKRDETHGSSIIQRDAAALLTVGIKDVKRVFTDLQKNTGKQSTDISTLKKNGLKNSMNIQGAFAAANASVAADLDAIAAANSGDATTQNDAATAKNAWAAAVTAAAADGNVLLAGVTQLGIDLHL